MCELGLGKKTSEKETDGRRYGQAVVYRKIWVNFSRGVKRVGGSRGHSRGPDLKMGGAILFFVFCDVDAALVPGKQNKTHANLENVGVTPLR